MLSLAKELKTLFFLLSMVVVVGAAAEAACWYFGRLDDQTDKRICILKMLRTMRTEARYAPRHMHSVIISHREICFFLFV